MLCLLCSLFCSQVDERYVAGDGFMLNLLSVLQQLSVKITLDTVNTALRKIRFLVLALFFLIPHLNYFNSECFFAG